MIALPLMTFLCAVGLVPVGVAGLATMRGSLSRTGNGYPPCDPTVKQHSGFFDISNQTNKHYFYWMVESRSNPTLDPVILWMTGGPGCSSSMALLVENGPCKVRPDLSVEKNEYSWNNVASVIYVDQPAGVGYSYADKSGYDSNEREVAEDMYHFMQAFYTQFPQFQNNPLYVFGESYGGHYAPAVSHRLWRGNKDKEGIPVPLAGVGVGNGLTQPEYQVGSYAKLAYGWCKEVLFESCVSEDVHASMLQDLPNCVEQIRTCNAGESSSTCSMASMYCSSQTGDYAESGRNPYDIRLMCGMNPLCYDFSAITKFLNSPVVMQSLTSRQDLEWSACNYEVNSMFSGDFMRDFGFNKFPDLLEDGIRVLIYAGDMDFICNWIGNKAWVTKMPWSLHDAFVSAPDQAYHVNGHKAGDIRTIGSGRASMLLTFATVHGAGHMVPMDQPERSLELLKCFLNDQPPA